MGDLVRARKVMRFYLADGIGPILFRRLVEAFGSVEEVLEASPRQWSGVEGVSARRAKAIEAVTDEQIEAEIARAAAIGAAIVCQGDDDYPESLLSLADPPMLLYVRGRIEPADATALGIVGSRRCSHYGIEQAMRFGQLLGRAGMTVVSGGARGIDTAAHRGALSVGARTLVVMGCGLDTLYPPENCELFEQILAADQGALISELPMGTGVKSENFPKRNRIITGLSLGLLVVEAAPNSGALISAKYAVEQGRGLFAVPGRVDSPASRGTNSLIREGATLVQDLGDILDDLGPVGQGLQPPEEELDRPRVVPSLTFEEARLLECLERGAMAIDDLAAAAAMPAGQVASQMTMLVLKGVVEQKPGSIFVRKAWVAGPSK